MQSPFSELYSKYYTLTQHLLSLASDHTLSIEELRRIVSSEGFLESPLSYLPLLLSQEEEGYHLLIKENDSPKEMCYHSILKHAPLPYLTHLELRWLKSLLTDQKLHLFLDDEDYYLLKKVLNDHEALISPESFDYVRQNVHQHAYTSPQYISCFKTLLTALQEEKLVTLTLDTDDSLLVAPYKLEYAILNDTFSLLAITIKDKKLTKLIRIPLDQINSVVTHTAAPNRELLDCFIKTAKCAEPLVFELNNMRSGFERVFMYLSPYERITQYNEEKDTCLVQLYYYPFDEAALIDMLMSFGPIIKIISPEPIRQIFKERIDKQFLLFANFFS